MVSVWFYLHHKGRTPTNWLEVWGAHQYSGVGALVLWGQAAGWWVVQPEGGVPSRAPNSIPSTDSRDGGHTAELFTGCMAGGWEAVAQAETWETQAWRSGDAFSPWGQCSSGLRPEEIGLSPALQGFTPWLGETWAAQSEPVTEPVLRDPSSLPQPAILWFTTGKHRWGTLLSPSSRFLHSLLSLYTSTGKKNWMKKTGGSN